jgi:hypothetical protein
MNRIELPSGAISGFAASTTFHAAPPPAVRAAQMACSGPLGSAVGFGAQPERFGASPRRNTTVLPLSEILICDIMIPSSFMKLVSRTGVKLGAAAVKAFLLPSA